MTSEKNHSLYFHLLFIMLFILNFSYQQQNEENEHCKNVLSENSIIAKPSNQKKMQIATDLNFNLFTFYCNHNIMPYESTSRNDFPPSNISFL